MNAGVKQIVYFSSFMVGWMCTIAAFGVIPAIVLLAIFSQQWLWLLLIPVAAFAGGASMLLVIKSIDRAIGQA